MQSNLAYTVANSFPLSGVSPRVLLQVNVIKTRKKKRNPYKGSKIVERRQTTEADSGTVTADPEGSNLSFASLRL